MSETEESIPESSSSEVRSIVLRIPGEHFFCETIDVPRNLDPDAVPAFADQALGEERLSPFPFQGRVPWVAVSEKNSTSPAFMTG